MTQTRIDARPEMVKLARRCWLPAADADNLIARCTAVVRTCAVDTVIASVTAARLHPLWLPTLGDDIHVATATPLRLGRTMTRTHRPEFIAHRFQLRPEDIIVVEGILVTSIARTWRDLASVLGVPDLVAAGDSAIRLGCTRQELIETIEIAPRRPGTRQARLAFGMLDERSRSRPETHLRVAVLQPDLPLFEVNEPVYRDEGGWLAEPDLSLAGAKLALEYQGADHANKKRMRKDITRALDMSDDRWLVREYGPAQVFGRPHAIYLQVRRDVADRAPHLLRAGRRLVAR